MSTLTLFFALIEGLFLVGFLLILRLHLQQKGTEESRRRLWTKYAWYLGIINAFLLLTFWGYPYFHLLLGAIIFAGLREFFAGLRHKGLQAYDTFGMCLGLGVFAGSLILAPSAFYPVVVVMLLLVLVLPILSGGPDQAVQKTALTLFAVWYVSVLTSHAVFIHAAENGPFRMAFLYTLLAINDGFAELLGRLVGSRPLCVTISPNKTVGGAVGGLLAALIGSLVFSFLLQGIPLHQCLLAGALIGVAGQTGDLVSSVIKRDLGIKDFSSLFPGHGGVLDRFDGLIFTAPMFYGFLKLIS
jgi:phosphatidate cytidylyltransferase